MAKKTRNRAAATTGAENPRRPCPCGSGKRYKACHGAGDDVIVIRPFAGLAAECDLVALREFLPSATAPLPLTGGGAVTIASVLPGASAGLVRDSGEKLVGMQVQTRSGDLSADLARAVEWTADAEPGSALPVVSPGSSAGSRLQDLVDAGAELDLTLHTDFAWWLATPQGQEPAADALAAVERANDVIMPTEVVAGEGVRAAYWVDTMSKAHIRWVRPEPEDELIAALARLQARDELTLGGESRYAGSFRAHGLLVPVWDVDREMHSSEWSKAAEGFAQRLGEALAIDAPLTSDEHRARDVLAGKQVTLR